MNILIQFSDWLHRKLRRCFSCHFRKSTWYYAPGIEEMCDECVPRGCSCNLEPVSEDKWYSSNPNDFKEPLDEKGRRYPCCEWMNFID